MYEDIELDELYSDSLNLNLSTYKHTLIYRELIILFCFIHENDSSCYYNKHRSSSIYLHFARRPLLIRARFPHTEP